MAQRKKRGRPGRPPKTDSERRKPWMMLHVSDQEKAEIRRRAAQQNQSASAYIRRTAYRGWTRRVDASHTLIRATKGIEDQIEVMCQDMTTPDQQRAMDAIEEQIAIIRRLIPKL